MKTATIINLAIGLTILGIGSWWGLVNIGVAALLAGIWFVADMQDIAAEREERRAEWERLDRMHECTVAALKMRRR